MQELQDKITELLGQTVSSGELDEMIREKLSKTIDGILDDQAVSHSCEQVGCEEGVRLSPKMVTALTEGAGQRFAQTREEMQIITDARRLLSDIAYLLADIDPQSGASSIDEDYKIAEWHTYEKVEMAKLLALVKACEQQASVVLSGGGGSSKQRVRARLGLDDGPVGLFDRHPYFRRPPYPKPQVSVDRRPEAEMARPDHISSRVECETVSERDFWLREQDRAFAWLGEAGRPTPSEHADACVLAARAVAREKAELAAEEVVPSVDRWVVTREGDAAKTEIVAPVGAYEERGMFAALFVARDVAGWSDGGEYDAVMRVRRTKPWGEVGDGEPFRVRIERSSP